MNPPKAINGHPVLAAKPSEHGEDNFVVLVNTSDRVTPFVTAVWSPRTGGEWVWGTTSAARPRLAPTSRSARS